MMRDECSDALKPSVTGGKMEVGLEMVLLALGFSREMESCLEFETGMVGVASEAWKRWGGARWSGRKIYSEPVVCN